MADNYFVKIGNCIGEMMAVIDAIQAKGTKPRLMKNLFELNENLKEVIK